MEYKFPIIDGHYHTEKLICKDGRLFWDHIEEYLERTGLQGVNLAALATTFWDVGLNMLALISKTRSDKVYAHAALCYERFPVTGAREGFDPLTQYKELMALGFDGIKMLETKPTEQKQTCLPLDHEFYEPFLAACEADGTHLLWHVADPEEFWDPDKVTKTAIEQGWAYIDGTFPPKEEFYRQVYTVLERHPNLNVTLAHFFFLSADGERLSKLFDTYPNVNVDLTPGCEMYGNFGKDPDYWRAFFIKYQDRIEFGTDAHNQKLMEGCMLKHDTVYQFLTTADEMEQWDLRFKGLDLPEAVCEKIFRGNYMRRIGPKPRKVQTALLPAYVAKYRHLVKDADTRTYIDREVAKL